MINIDFIIQKYFGNSNKYAYITLRDTYREFSFSSNKEELENLIVQLQEAHKELSRNDLK